MMIMFQIFKNYLNLEYNIMIIKFESDFKLLKIMNFVACVFTSTLLSNVFCGNHKKSFVLNKCVWRVTTT